MSATKSNRASIDDNNVFEGIEDTEEEKTIVLLEGAATAKPKKPNKIKKGYRQTAIILPDDQLRWLADSANRSTRDEGIVIYKTTIIQWLVNVAREVNLDLSGIQADEEIAERFKEAVV